MIDKGFKSLDGAPVKHIDIVINLNSVSNYFVCMLTCLFTNCAILYFYERSFSMLIISMESRDSANTAQRELKLFKSRRMLEINSKGNNCKFEA